MFWWVEFSNKRMPGTLRASSESEAREKGMQHGEVESVSILPYPASPYLTNDVGCPPFCYSPLQCKGRTSCPKAYACSE